MLTLAFLIGFGVIGGIGLLLAGSALGNPREEGADAALNGGMLLVALAMIGAAIVLF
jgi:hypothetical protein